MGYEIDYIPVGDGERAGDAIAIRYGNLSLGAPRDEQIVMVIDGGTKDSGAELVNRVLTHYQTDRVNYVFSTHLDNDHLSGLTVVLDNLKVDGLYMHLPWNHASETNELFKGNFTDSKLEQTLKKSLDTVHEVEELARQKNIPVIEPFAGMSVNNNIVILGPTKEYYELLLCQFREAPEMRKSALQEAIEMVKKVIKAAEEMP